MPKQHTPQILLGFDFGLRCIGVAVGQVITQSATALTVLPAKDGVPDWDKIAKLIEMWKIDTLIVGIPLNMDGTEQPITLAAKRFARKLHGRFHLPVCMVDERLTTFEASYEQKQKRNQKKRAKTERLDSQVAKIILESWLREHYKKGE